MVLFHSQVVPYFSLVMAIIAAVGDLTAVRACRSCSLLRVHSYNIPSAIVEWTSAFVKVKQAADTTCSAVSPV